MTRTALIAVAFLIAGTDLANARPVQDWQCGKLQVAVWPDKDRYFKEEAAGVAEPKMHLAHTIWARNGKLQRLPERLFRHDVGTLTYKGKRCEYIPYEESDQ